MPGSLARIKPGPRPGGPPATLGVAGLGEREAWGLRVPRERAEEARRMLAEAGALERGLRPVREGNYVVFPVSSAEAAEPVARRVGGEFVRRVFPEYRRPGRLEGPVKGYSLIGDIAVFSRTAGVSIEEYRGLAERLLEQVPRVRSVWLKEATLGDYRVARLVHLAGEERTRTVAREYGLVFHVDIARAYYNPRLAYEHRRVAEQARDGERILDMFTGVGGFAVHAAALARVDVVASDLNPHAAMLAAENAEANARRLRGVVHVLRADARLLPGILRPVFDRIILNHPTASTGFAGEACALAARPSVLYFYRLTLSCLEAEGEVQEALEAAGCRARVRACRRVLDYSPSEAVYVVEAEAW